MRIAAMAMERILLKVGALNTGAQRVVLRDQRSACAGIEHRMQQRPVYLMPRNGRPSTVRGRFCSTGSS